jgi:hypothetical protein
VSQPSGQHSPPGAFPTNQYLGREAALLDKTEAWFDAVADLDCAVSSLLVTLDQSEADVRELFEEALAEARESKP